MTSDPSVETGEAGKGEETTVMTSNRKLHVLGLVATVVGGLSLVVACGSSDDTDGGASGSGGGGGSTGCSDCVVPPTAPADGVPGDGAGTVMAARKWYFGDTSRSGAADPNAWKKFGYDLDGEKSNQNSSNHCKLVEGANDAVKTDGDGGIDNSFGPNLLPLLLGIDSQFPTTINDNVTAGSFAMILEIEDIGSGKNYTNLPGALYFGAELASEPVWDGSDVWPLYCDLMSECKTSGTSQRSAGNKSLVTFPNSYVADGTWVSSTGANVTLVLAVGGITISLDIKKAVITAEMGSGDPPTSATNGIIAGILETEQVVTTISQTAGFISSSLCEGDALNELKNSIRQSSDIMQNGTQNPDATCDGISVGLGIDLEAVQLGEVLDATSDAVDPCAG
jgi:hypothetical protein